MQHTRRRWGKWVTNASLFATYSAAGRDEKKHVLFRSPAWFAGLRGGRCWWRPTWASARHPPATWARTPRACTSCPVPLVRIDLSRRAHLMMCCCLAALSTVLRLISCGSTVTPQLHPNGAYLPPARADRSWMRRAAGAFLCWTARSRAHSRSSSRRGWVWLCWTSVAPGRAPARTNSGPSPHQPNPATCTWSYSIYFADCF